jgi:S-formylglutathione hydrolase FrmB
VRTIRGILVLALVLLPLAPAGAQSWRKDSNELEVINNKLRGKIVDHTANHGVDNRIWSRQLYQRRDVYVYLPPGYDPNLRYPVMIWLHGFGQDEQSFAEHVAPEIDAAMCCGKLPPFIVVAPDGSLTGEPKNCITGSWFLNSAAGAFEDYILQDVWDFVCWHYPIRSERDAHVLAGVSMGGFAAYNWGIKHRDAFGVVIGIHPPLNLRWVDDNGVYWSDFDPRHWGWRTNLNDGKNLVQHLYGSLVTGHIHSVLDPVFGHGPEAMQEIMHENPIEMIDAYQLREGQLQMYVAFGGQDQYNVHTQVESFLYLCKCRGLTVCVGYEQYGCHDCITARRLTPGIFDWLAPRLAPYSPTSTCAGCPACPTCNPNNYTPLPRPAQRGPVIPPPLFAPSNEPRWR